MQLYRISNCQHAADISGTGAKLFGGRWNSIGTPMHYMASSRALAALEILANKNALITVDNLCLSIFDAPEESIKTILASELPKGWRSYPSNIFLKNLGDQFIRDDKYLLLKVPSAIIDEEFNFLMNVQHSLVKKVKLIEIKPFHFDNRLI